MVTLLIDTGLADAVRAYGIRAACRESDVPRPTVMRCKPFIIWDAT